MNWIDILLWCVVFLCLFSTGFISGVFIGLKRNKLPKEPAGTVIVFNDPDSPDKPYLYLELQSVEHLKDDWIILAVDRHSQK